MTHIETDRGIKIEGSKTKKYKEIIDGIILSRGRTIKKSNWETNNVYTRNSNLDYHGFIKSKIININRVRHENCLMTYRFSTNNGSNVEGITLNDFLTFQREKNTEELINPSPPVVKKVLQPPMDYKVGELYYSNGSVIEIIKQTKKQYQYVHCYLVPTEDFYKKVEEDGFVNQKVKLENFTIEIALKDNPSTLRYNHKQKEWDRELEPIDLNKNMISTYRFAYDDNRIHYYFPRLKQMVGTIYDSSYE